MTNFIKIFDVCDDCFYPETNANEVKINKPLIEDKDFADELYVVEEANDTYSAALSTIVHDLAEVLMKHYGLDTSKEKEVWHVVENCVFGASETVHKLAFTPGQQETNIS